MKLMPNYSNPFNIVIMVLLAVILCAAPAFAGVPGWAKITEFISGTAIALIVSGIMTIGVVAKYTDWVSVIALALGALLISFGNAIADHKLTKEEWADWKVKLKDLRASLRKPKKNA